MDDRKVLHDELGYNSPLPRGEIPQDVESKLPAIIGDRTPNPDQLDKAWLVYELCRIWRIDVTLILAIAAAVGDGIGF